ncbi:MAG: hypothetical protein Q7J35_05490 [Candidatus Methanoperedens sp.]|nr:hypothetical protein [Candidatus Methanoperedens sp.]
MFSFSTMYAIFAVMVVVLPAPARISRGEGYGFRIGAGGGFRQGLEESEKYAPPKTICETAEESTFDQYHMNGAGVRPQTPVRRRRWRSFT